MPRKREERDGAVAKQPKYKRYPAPDSLPAGTRIYSVSSAGMHQYRWALWASPATAENYAKKVSPSKQGYAETETKACAEALATAPGATRISNSFSTPGYLSQQRCPGGREFERDHWTATGLVAAETADRWRLPQAAWRRALCEHHHRRAEMSAIDWLEAILREAGRLDPAPEEEPPAAAAGGGVIDMLSWRKTRAAIESAAE